MNLIACFQIVLSETAAIIRNIIWQDITCQGYVTGRWHDMMLTHRAGKILIRK